MAESKLEVMLRLEPLGSEEKVPFAENGGVDDWLNNDSAQLLGADEAQNEAPDLNATISELMHTNAGRALKCSVLQLRSGGDGFLVLTDNGEMPLVDGDIICLPGVNLRANLVQEHIVPVDEPQQAFQAPDVDPDDDIWANPMPNANNSFANPFVSTPDDPFKQQSQQPVMPQFAQQPVQEDPLDFLYGGDTRQTQPTSQFDFRDQYAAPQLSGPDPLLVDNNAQNYDEGLNINTRAQYSYGAAPNNFVNPVQQPPQARQHAPEESAPQMANAEQDEGNVLHDLGIDPASSTIINKQYTGGKSSFLEQSPMDMLDEFLEDDDLRYVVQPEAPYYEPQSSQPVRGRDALAPEQSGARVSGFSGLAQKAKRAVRAFKENE